MHESILGSQDWLPIGSKTKSYIYLYMPDLQAAGLHKERKGKDKGSLTDFYLHTFGISMEWS